MRLKLEEEFSTGRKEDDEQNYHKNELLVRSREKHFIKKKQFLKFFKS